MSGVPNATRLSLFAAGLVLLAFVAAAGVAGSAPDDRPRTTASVDVPGDYSFELPDEAGTATVGDWEFDSLQAALDAAAPGETVQLTGRFEGSVVVRTPNLTLAAPSRDAAVINGSGQGDVLTVDAPGVTLRQVWVRNSGYKPSENDATIMVNASHVTIRDSRITETTFGIWLDVVSDARVVNNTIVGRERVWPLSQRGNGIEVFESNDTLLAENRITDVRDGIYYSWASDVLGRNNTMWDLRYGVHYMYSDDCTLVGNTATRNDAGYALMVSKRLELRDNVAVNNTGGSGHGILLKSIDDTQLVNNTLVGNGNGLYVYNSLDNRIAWNVVRDNDVGVHLTAGSVRETVTHNTFVGNRQPVYTVIGEQVVWNRSVGNFWAGATRVDLDGDGVSEVRYRPAGAVERLTATTPEARLYVDSPAFEAIRRAESTVPLIETPGVVDHRPLIDPPHRDWRDLDE